MSTPNPTPGKTLPRVLGVSGVAFASFNCIVGSGIFGLPALAAALLGPAAILSYCVCLILIGLVGLCFAEAGSRVSSAGGLYAYARVAHGPVVGGIAGTLIWFANCMASGAAIANFLVDTLSTIWPGLAGGGPRITALAVIYGLLAAVNIGGTRTGERLSTTIGLTKVVPLVVLIVVGAFAAQTSNLHWTSVPAVATVAQGALLMFFAFMGVENGLGASGETIDPARTVPRALLLSLSLVAALYIGLQLVTQGVLGAQLPHAQAPLVATATVVFGSWGAPLFLITTVLLVSGYLIADMLCSPRTFYALAEEGQLPHQLARVSRKNQTPAVAIAIYSLGCFVMAASGSFRQLAVVAASGTLMLYFMCCLGVLRLRKRRVAMAGEPFHAPGGSFVPIAACVMIVWMLSTLAWRELSGLLAVVVISGISYALRQRRPGPTPMPQAG